MNKQDRSKKPQVYSALEVANICGVVNQTAINWIRSGHLKAFTTPGGQFRVYPEDLADFMEGRKMHVPEQVLEDMKKNGPKTESILIVDDDKAFNDVTMKFLQKNIQHDIAELEIHQAYDGFEAGALLMQKKPGVVILDLDLPGIDGFGVCKKIQEMDSSSRPKVIVVTGMQDQESEDRCMSLGVFKYIKKPVNLPELAETIKNL